jgi:thiamine biosynthesis lipoprotein
MEAIVRSHNIRAYCINAGGDIVLGDPKPGKELWHIGIQHPRDKDRAIKMLDESNLCIATSGDYERYFDEGGVRYHHIFDPKTGRPAVGLSSATVLCRDPVRAVVYSKVLIVNRAKDGLGNLPGILSYTVIDTSMRVRMFEKGKPVKG